MIMVSKLFIICPFSSLELFLENRFGAACYFISSPGSVSPFDDPVFNDSIKCVVQNEKIAELYITIDTNCRFLNNVLNKLSVYDTKWEYKLQTIFERHFSEITSAPDKQKQQEMFAQKIIMQQVSDVFKISEITSVIIDSKIKLKGLVTTRTSSLCREINIPTSNNNELPVFSNGFN